jgi:hypothetical protein
MMYNSRTVRGRFVGNLRFYPEVVFNPLFVNQRSPGFSLGLYSQQSHEFS